MVYFVIFGIVLFVTVAMTVAEGLWNNLLLLFCVVLSGLTAFGLHQPLTVMLDERTDGSYTYLLDILVLWLVYAVTVTLLKTLTQQLSRVKVAFEPKPLDQFGGIAVGVLTGWLLAGFTLATLHTAPLARDYFGDKLDYGLTRKEAEANMAKVSPITTPDAAWLALTEAALSPAVLGGEGFSASLYASSYAQHRDKFGKITDSIVKRR
ncbi:Colicin V production protein [Pseudobythopirellula maris]|uniref:Colicin V production protein n=1 Tax=Pseudobythopirellula maris TaxID=2527991 RepID=A0A5C5ZJJ7_9BACT|nr:CvpA family protein [Pseudobythopirellula maris]TWT87552.1 Colicin V production protein [Pseudobythopirellula maris]